MITFEQVTKVNKYLLAVGFLDVEDREGELWEEGMVSEGLISEQRSWAVSKELFRGGGKSREGKK